MYVLKRTNLYKTAFHEKVAQIDQDKKKWLEMVCESLCLNKVLMQETYLTLMLISLNKSHISNYSLSVGYVTRIIADKKLQVFREKVEIQTDVVDFDVDFYFGTLLQNLTKFNAQTRQQFLNDFVLFMRQYYRGFMRIVASQVTGQGNNTFIKNLIAFYYRLSQQALEKFGDPQATETLVQLCTYMFTETHDFAELKQLAESDERDLWFFRRIVVFFDDNTQM